MCQAAKPVRSVVLFEGQAKWIMERETPEERLAALEAILAIAFPPDEEHPYVPPPLPADGSRLSPCDKTKRDVYNLFKDLIESRAMRTNGKLKDLKKVEAGRLGAAMRFAKRGESSTAAEPLETETDVEVESPQVDDMQSPATPSPVMPTPIAEDDFSGFVAGGNGKVNLTKSDKMKIAGWDKKIPDAKALQEYLKTNYLFQNKKLVMTDEFCEFAYQKLAKIDMWISRRDNRPFNDIRHAVYWMSLDYMKKAGEIRRAEREEKRKDLEADLEMKNTMYSQQSPSEIATIERKRRRAAEKEAVSKIIKGEL